MQHKRMKVLGLLGATTVATLFSAGEASAIEFALDTFEDQQYDDTQDLSISRNASSGTTVNQTISDSGTNNILGGERFAELTKTNNGGAALDSYTTTGIVLTDENQNNVTNESSDGTLSLTYDNFSNVDLTGGGTNTGILFETFGSDQGQLTFKISNGNANYSQTEDFANATTNGRLFLSYSDFGASSSDLQSVDQINLDLSSSGANEDVGLDSIGFVESENSDLPQSSNPNPVPFEAETSIGLALLGAWGAWKRWKSKQQAS